MTTFAEVGLKPVTTHKADAWGTGTQTSAAVDTIGFSHALIEVDAGTATGTLDVALHDSAASGSGFAAALNDSGVAIAFTQITSSNDDTTYYGLIRLDRRQRYLKLVAVVATNAVDFSSRITLLNPNDSKRVSGSGGLTLAFEV